MRRNVGVRASGNCCGKGRCDLDYPNFRTDQLLRATSKRAGTEASGLTSKFSPLVRAIACEIRGDVAEENVPLSLTPEISVQGVKTVHGYGIGAESTFWSKEGILHFTSLRDSLDEQTVADILASILNK